MPNQMFRSLSGADATAVLQRTANAAGFVRLYKSTLVPTPATPLADFVSNEANYDGYVAGGIVTTTWNPPILAAEGGYSIQSPLVQFVTDPAEATPNLIGGWFFVLSGGGLQYFGTYDTPQPMQVPGQGLAVTIRDVFPTGG